MRSILGILLLRLIDLVYITHILLYIDSTEAIFYVVDGKAPRVDLSREPNVSTLLVCLLRGLNILKRLYRFLFLTFEY